MEFKKYKIKDIANIVTDYVANGSFKSLKENVNFSDDENYSILIRLVDYNNNFKGPFKYVDKKGYEYLKKTKLFGEEIIISNVGANAGTVFKVPYFNKPMTLGPNAIMVKLKGNNDYFYYYFKSSIGQFKLKSILSGSAQPKFNKTDFKNLDIEVSDLKSQVKIGNFLKTIDKKIENNKNIIVNLEELSQTLFKRWFVDFEFPDEDGNPYKSSGGEMVDSELGKIPSNWKIYKLKDIARHKKETFNPKKSEEVTVKHFSLPAYDNEEQAIEEEVNKIKSNKWIINNNCVLFSKMNPDTQRIWLPVIDNEKLNVASSEFVVMESPNNKINSFIYNICLNSQFIDYLKANTTGSTNSRQRVKPTIAVNYKLAVEDSIVKKYSEIITPYMEEMKILRSEIGKLTQLRDTLLPKLMSGELEIPDDIEVNIDELSI